MVVTSSAPLTVPAGRPSSLTEELIPLAARVAEQCPSYAAIGRALGVQARTVSDWIAKGSNPDAPDLFRRFSQAILKAINTAEINLTLKLGEGDSKDAAWLLTHSPFFRDEWSDAAAERRTERKTVATMLEAMTAAGLPADMERTLLLQMQARGLGAQVEGDA